MDPVGGVRIGVRRTVTVDRIVIDYLWGAPAKRAMRALVTHRRDRGRPLDWIQIGSWPAGTSRCRPLPCAPRTCA
jgi:hypothetical protein